MNTKQMRAHLAQTALMPERPMPPTPTTPRRLPEIPTRERAAMRTQLMTTRRAELAETRVSELPAELAAALTKVAHAAARFAVNEARACVHAVLYTLNSGALEIARRRAESYAQRVGFIGEPPPDEQEALRFELAIAYRRMTPEQRWQFDDLFADLRRKYPRAWIAYPFAR